VASATAALFFIGHRTKALLRGRIAAEFAGWLMTDGYQAYREYQHRLRCWAHLIRKARALAESFTPPVQSDGVALLETFDFLIDPVYQAREGPPQDLREILADDLTRLKALCEKMAHSPIEKAAQLGREFLNDWDAIFQVLAHPELPLTNHFAERLLRHWVILRRITYGTRTQQGNLALATFASIIETCRLRKASPLRYLHQVLAATRKGLEAPALPPISAVA
jgi:transposase